MLCFLSEGTRQRILEDGLARPQELLTLFLFFTYFLFIFKVLGIAQGSAPLSGTPRLCKLENGPPPNPFTA